MGWTFLVKLASTKGAVNDLFSESGKRKIHERTRTSEKPYACTYEGCAVSGMHVHII